MTPTLPGTIPGLLRRCSPVFAPVSATVRATGRRAIVEGEHLDAGLVLLADGTLEPAEMLSLDLSDPTGRAHAARWLFERPGAGSVHRWPTVTIGDLTYYPHQIYQLACYAQEWQPLDEGGWRPLALAVLHVAGLS
jgi:hypothetical protein